MAGVGSILEQLRPEFSGTVWDPVCSTASRLRCRTPGTPPCAAVSPGRCRESASRWRWGIPGCSSRGTYAAGIGGAPWVSCRTACTTVTQMYSPSPSATRRRARDRHPRTRDKVVRAIGRCDAVNHQLVAPARGRGLLRHPGGLFTLSPGLWGGSFEFEDDESVVNPAERAVWCWSATLLFPPSSRHRPRLGRSLAAAGDALVAAFDAEPMRPFAAISSRRRR